MYANNASSYKPGNSRAVQFGAAAVEFGLTTATGDAPDQAITTSASARTYLQPQLHKLCFFLRYLLC